MPEAVLVAFDCTNLERKLHDGVLGYGVLSNKVQMGRQVIFAMIMELVLRDLVKSWKIRMKQEGTDVESPSGVSAEVYQCTVR